MSSPAPALESPAAAAPTAAAVSPCPNCGEAAPLRYCPGCGQKQGPLHPSMRALAHEFADEVFNVDAKLPRSLFLLFRPGFLTAEYLAGRRERYVRPFRLFLVTSVAVLLAIAAVPTLKPDASASSAAAGHNQAGLDFLVHAFGGYDGPLGTHLRRFTAGGPEATSNRIRAAFLEYSTKVNMVALPLFALILLALYRRPGSTYGDHFVFGLHYHAFYFALNALVTTATRWLPWSAAMAGGFLFTLWVWGYLFLALRRVYAEGWLATLGKQIALLVAYAAVQFALTAGMIVLAVMRA